MNKLFYDLLDKLTLGVLLINDQHEIVLWNEWMASKTQMSSVQVINHKLSEICPRFALPMYKTIIQNAFDSGHGRFISGAVHGSFFNQEALEGSDVSFRQNLQIEVLDSEEKRFVLIQVHDISSQHKKVQQMKHFIKTLETENDEIRQIEEESRLLAQTDPLTGLHNRLSFMSHLSSLVHPIPPEKELTGIVYLDLDAFKSVNDQYGHAVGDAVLQETAHRLKASVRSTDLVCRLGGDEFTLILNAIHSITDLVHIANKIFNSFTAPFQIGTLTLKVNCSFGLSIMPQDGHETKELMEKADLALYRVKKLGKAGFAFYSEKEKVYR